jgi:CubicO group peptidase (beta-lactamase class C family)
MNVFHLRSRLPLALVSLLLIFSCWSPVQASSPADSLDLLIAAKMRQLRIPGLQLAVVRHGRIVKLGNYGVANVQDSVPVTTDTLFP